MKKVMFGLVLLAGCDPQKIALGQGGADDARLFADVYTWQCEERSDTETLLYDGVFSYQVALEYAPDDLTARELPASGCTSGLDMFPSDAGSEGTNIPEVGNPTWSNGDLSGTLLNESAGFYFDDVYGDVQNCTYAEDLIGEGTKLSDAGSFSGATTPPAGTLDNVEISNYDESTGLTFGETVDVSWTMKGWDDAWVQIRTESMGELADSVTCNTGGANSYTVDEDVWSLMNSAVEADVTNLFVTVQNASTVTTEDGQKIEVITRVVHAAVVR
ncbi:hypothetical protein LBMAG42_15170 [Deltaproteobacteria bacterium]|nr:hypothetical protein LBMAG42_15170 [Deltaproteobacteria bacterium]